jgi:hypothetical protein
MLGYRNFPRLARWLAALPICIHLTFDAGPAALEERGQATTVGQLDESIYLKAGHPVV